MYTKECVCSKEFNLPQIHSHLIYNFEMPCEAGGIGTNVPGQFKAKAGNLLLSTLEPYNHIPLRTQA